MNKLIVLKKMCIIQIINYVIGDLHDGIIYY